MEIQENLCFVGGIPIISQFAHKKFPSEIRQEAAAFVRQMYQTSTLTLQMFIGCGGLNVLVEFLEEDLEDDRDFVLIGVNGVWSVFNLQVSTETGCGRDFTNANRDRLRKMTFAVSSPGVPFFIHSLLFLAKSSRRTVRLQSSLKNAL